MCVPCAADGFFAARFYYFRCRSTTTISRPEWKFVWIDRTARAAARVRESTCLLEFPARLFVAQYERNSNLQQAIHQSLLRSLARTNTQLTRLISHARLTSSTRAALELEKALHAQVVNVKNQ